MQIYVEEDVFLKRASSTKGLGSSSSKIACRKDATLKEYLKNLDHTKVFNFLFVSSDAHNKSVVHY